MSLIDDIKRDREAGAEGPWHLHDCKDWDGRATYHYQEVWTEDCDVIAAEVYRAHNDGGMANMSRIARIPDMEAALLAAEELAEKLDLCLEVLPSKDAPVCCSGYECSCNGVTEHQEAISDARTALAAFQKAVK